MAVNSNICYVTVWIEGQEFQRQLEPETNLREVLEWDGRDVYGSAVVGKTEVKVSASYHYTDCQWPVVDTKVTQIYV